MFFLFVSPLSGGLLKLFDFLFVKLFRLNAAHGVIGGGGGGGDGVWFWWEISSGENIDSVLTLETSTGIDSIGAGGDDGELSGDNAAAMVSWAVLDVFAALFSKICPLDSFRKYILNEFLSNSNKGPSWK